MTVGMCIESDDTVSDSDSDCSIDIDGDGKDDSNRTCSKVAIESVNMFWATTVMVEVSLTV